MRYIQNIERPSTLTEGSNVKITVSDGITYTGIVRRQPSRNTWFISIVSYDNDIVFDILGLNRITFVSNIVGYTPRGKWPETHTLEELSNVLDALLEVNKPEDVEAIEITEEIKEVEEIPTPTSEWDWLLN